MGLSFVRRRDLGDFSYFLSNHRGFFHRHGDSGFSTKWTGLWSMEKKFLEYFAFKLGDEWLSPVNCSRLEYDMAKAGHFYRTEKGEVKETVFMPEGSGLVVALSLKRPAELELELAVNIRKRFENENRRIYYVWERGGGLVVGNDLGFLSLRALSGDMSFEKSCEFREHSPGGEKQNFLVPGKIALHGKSIVLALSPESNERIRNDCRSMLREKESCYNGLVRNMIKSDNKELVKGFNSSVLGIELLKKKPNGFHCYYAGLPWFQQFWGRDVFWFFPSLLSLGRFDDAKDCLRFFAVESKEGIPNLISKAEGNLFNSIDATLLWMRSMHDYFMVSGDTGFLKSMGGRIVSLTNYILGRGRDCFMEHDRGQSETWMDTLRRGSMAVEVQALYFDALRSASRMLGELGESGLAVEAGKSAECLGKEFDRKFYSSGFYADRITDSGSAVNTKTANALVPVMLGLGSHGNEILKIIESEIFTTDSGVRTRASGEEGYSPSGYHTGSAWSLTTAWASAAEFASGRPEQGWSYMRTLLEDTEREALGCIGECRDSGSNALTGCSLQLWGSGFIPRLVDEFMLGLRIDAREKSIEACPSLPRGIRMLERERRVGKRMVRIMFEKRNGKMRASCSRPFTVSLAQARKL